jgi:hypothetical protein
MASVAMATFVTQFKYLITNAAWNYAEERERERETSY